MNFDVVPNRLKVLKCLLSPSGHSSQVNFGSDYILVLYLIRSVSVLAKLPLYPRVLQIREARIKKLALTPCVETPRLERLP